MIVFDSPDIDDVIKKPGVIQAAGRLARMGLDQRANTFISYLPAFGAEKVGLDDQYVKVGCDGAELRRILTVFRRPADPEQRLEFLSAKWKTWDSKQQDRELLRATLLTSVIRDSDEDFQHWLNDAKRHLRLLKSDLQRLASSSSWRSSICSRERSSVGRSAIISMRSCQARRCVAHWRGGILCRA